MIALEDKTSINSNIDKIVFYACVIDILFMPYFWVISMSYSLPLITLWFILNNNKYKNSNDFILFIAMACIMISSTIFSFIIYPRYIGELDVWLDNIKRLIQYISTFFYYFFFKYYFSKYNVRLRKLLIAFMFFAFIFSVIYYFDINQFINIKLIWNNKDSFIIMHRQGLLADFRYNFTWTDPNNPAYLFVAVSAYLYINENVNFKFKAIILFMLAFMLVMSMSTGAMLSFVLVAFAIAFYWIYQAKYKKIRLKRKISLTSVFFIIIMLVLAIFLMSRIKNLFDSSLVSRALDRITNNSESGSGRLSVWKDMISGTNWLKFIFIGRGATTIFNDRFMSPHNGHLYFSLSYGIISYLIFIFLLFRKGRRMPWKNYIFMIPIIIGFSINILIVEQKALLLWILLLTSARNQLQYMGAKINGFNKYNYSSI